MTLVHGDTKHVVFMSGLHQGFSYAQLQLSGSISIQVWCV